MNKTLSTDATPRADAGVASARAFRRPSGFALLAVALGALSVAWVVLNELVHGSVLVGTSVPTIPSLAALLLVAALGGLLYRRSRAEARKSATLRIYLLVGMATSVASLPSLWYIFTYITAPQYLSATQPGMARISKEFPRWFAPTRGEAIRQFYEGGATGVPWAVWGVPLLAWGVFLCLLLALLYALLALLRSAWMEGERLSYPIVEIPMRLADGARARALWRNPLFWVGFLLAAAFDGMNMFHSFFPWFPSMGINYDLAGSMTSLPWSALSPLSVSYRPEILGIAYLMPTDVLMTTWVSYLGLRLLGVARASLGENIVSTPYDYTEYSIGAFVTLFVLLLWRARPELSRSLRCAFAGKPTGRDEPLSPRAAWVLLGGGTLVLLAWMWLAGLPLWLAAAHLTLLVAVAIVYARMRAETGAPMGYLFPFWQQQHVLTNFLGTNALGGESSQVIFAALGGLSRGNLPETSAYGPESMKIAAQGGIPQRKAALVVLGGIALGLFFGGYLYLTLAYRHGVNQLRGDYQVLLATQQYNQTLQAFASPVKPKTDLIIQTLEGGLVAAALNFLRVRFFWFPLHPMGFAMASAYGYHLWAPFLLAWLVKKLASRFSGQNGYVQLVPIFLGLALGRYLFCGLLWGVLGAFGHPATRAYYIQFG